MVRFPPGRIGSRPAMFDLSWSELLVIAVVALIAIGPKQLPGALRTFGQWMGRVRRMASEFQSQFNEAMREAEVEELRKQVQDLSDTARSYTHFDPLSDVQNEINNLSDDGKDHQTPPRRDGDKKPETAKKDVADTGTGIDTQTAPGADKPLPPPAASAEASAPAESTRSLAGEPKSGQGQSGQGL